MRVTIEGPVGKGVSAKDIVLAIIGHIGTAGGTGYSIEFAGQGIRDLSMEGRMTVCNMAIEAGARAGMIAVDDVTIDYVKGRPYTPTGDAWNQAVDYWQQFISDDDAVFDQEIVIQGSDITPQVTWGTSPEMVISVKDAVPDPQQESDSVKREGMQRALDYMDLKAGTPIQSIAIDKVFIGSCTNSRIEDLREAAAIARDHKVADNVKLAMVVPGSGLVKPTGRSGRTGRYFQGSRF